MSALLEADGIRVSYGKIEAVKGVTLRVPQGSIVTVIGPNGAGKTTTLHALIGLLPCEGEIRLGGESLRHRSVERRVAAGMVLVPEKRELFGQMSVEDNLLMGSYTRRRASAAQTAVAFDSVYARFPRLRERRTQIAASLSGGERQMLAIGRALMSSPKLIMFDEPSLGLAPIIVGEMFKIISRLKETGVSVLLIEQNAKAALSNSDYGYVFERGEIVCEGTSEALARDRRVAEVYLGSSQSADH